LQGYGLMYNDTIEIINFNGEEDNPYISSLVRLTNIDSIYLSQPKQNRLHKGLEKDRKYALRFKSRGKTLFCWAIYTRNTYFKNKSVIVFRPITEPTVVHKREHFRLKQSAIIEFLALDYGEANNAPKITALMLDISLGGARILTGIKLKKKDLILMDITIGATVLKQVLAEVVNITRVNMESSVGVKFRDITQENLKALTDYIIR